MDDSRWPVLQIGNQVRWIGVLEMIMAGRTGTVVEVSLNSTRESPFTSYRIRRDDGGEGTYYISQLELASSTDPTPQP